MTPAEFKALRLKAGYETRGSLAEAMGITRWAIEHWEYGRRPIPAWGEKLLKCLMMAKLAEERLGLKL
jgi:DNA-binding transcriptional regulator YiaG